MINDKQINEFFERLIGEEGCNFIDNKWNCNGGNNKNLSIEILKKMNIPKEERVEFLKLCHTYGGHCDCEIVFNSMEYIIDEK